MEDTNNEREKTAEPVKKTSEMNGLLPIKAIQKRPIKRTKAQQEKMKPKKDNVKQKPTKKLKTP